MHIASRVAIALVVLAMAAPSAVASEDWPPYGWTRFVTYYGGSCNTTPTYNGHFEVDCWDDPWYFGTRSGQWRATIDTHCNYSYPTVEKYEVCTSGSNCSANSGTWQEITYEQFEAGYCP